MPSCDAWPIRKELDFLDLGYVVESLAPESRYQLGVPAVEAFQCHLETKLEHIRNTRYGHQTDQLLLERLLNLQYGQRQAVQVHDVDTLDDYVLFLYKYPHKWFLQGRWKEDFIDRRGLKRGDVIGLCWDAPNMRLNFKVLYKGETDN